MSAYAGIICTGCGPVDLDKTQYVSQMAEINAFWRCPKCNRDATFDDARYEEIQNGINNMHRFGVVELCTVEGAEGGPDVVELRPEFIAGVDDSIKQIVQKHLTALTVELNKLTG